MAPTIPTEVPAVITAGETVQFKRTFQGFAPADGWQYSFDLIGPTAAIHKNAEVDSDPFLLTLSPTDTAPLNPKNPKGDVCPYQENVTLSTDPTQRFTVGDGTITVQQNLSIAQPGDTLTHAQKMIERIEAVLEGRIADDVQSYSIGAGTGARALVKIPIKELQQLLGIYKAQVNAAANPNALGTPVKVMFPEIAPSNEYPPTWIDVTGINQP